MGKVESKHVLNLIDLSREFLDCAIKNNEYNFLESLGISNKEVLLTRLIYSLISKELNPKYYKLFLDKFLEIVLELDIKGDKNSGSKVFREYSFNENIDGERVSGHIDLAIEYDKKFIPIEIKLYARDQPEQCYRYLKYADYKNRKHDSSNIYYLTLLGTKPSQNAFKVNEEVERNQGVLSREHQRVILISFSRNIRNWLSQCADSIEDEKELIWSAIETLKRSIDKMCNNGKQINDEIIEMLNRKSDGLSSNFEVAIAIKDAINTVPSYVFGAIVNKYEQVNESVKIAVRKENSVVLKSIEYKNPSKYEIHVILEYATNLYLAVVLIDANGKRVQDNTLNWFRSELDKFDLDDELLRNRKDMGYVTWQHIKHKEEPVQITIKEGNNPLDYLADENLDMIAKEINDKSERLIKILDKLRFPESQ